MNGRSRRKVFLALECGSEKRTRMVLAVFHRVFRGWDRETGMLGVAAVDGALTHQKVRELLRDRCGLFDLTGEKRRQDNGINLNVLLEMGIALGLGRPAFAIYDSRVVTRTTIERRVADIKGCSIYEYKGRRGLEELMTRLRIGCLRKLGLA